MQSVRHFRELPVDAIRELLAACDRPFQPSELGAADSSSSSAEPALRLSESRRVFDPSLASLCEKLVYEVSVRDDEYCYTLCHDHVTHSRHPGGSHFDRHIDLPVRPCRDESKESKHVEEFTLLVNVNPEGVACEGGQTLVHAPGGGPSSTSVKFFDTTSVAGGGLLFRKDVAYQGNKVLSGEKHLISLNLWGRPRSVEDPAFVASFAVARSDGAAASEASADAPPPTDRMVMPAEMASISSVLCAVIDEANKDAADAGKVRPSLVHYRCPVNVGYADFDVVRRVVCQMDLTLEMLQRAKPTLDIYFPGCVPDDFAEYTAQLLKKLGVEPFEGLPGYKRQRVEPRGIAVDTAMEETVQFLHEEGFDIDKLLPGFNFKAPARSTPSDGNEPYPVAEGNGTVTENAAPMDCSANQTTVAASAELDAASGSAGPVA